ncbi:MAG: protein phosphatase 2C domain-containing protein [Thermoanaerobaculia bacterium]|nr:protein phosphatase 2C domain-containing protein [Thermoanaerobaculia bacterium]
MAAETPNMPELDLFGLTDTGKRRSNNEDQFLVARLAKSMEPLFTSLSEDLRPTAQAAREAFLFVVADGVGGAVGGELASGKTVETLAEQIAATAGCFYSTDPEAEDELIGKLEEAIRKAHERVRSELEMDGSRPASTATMVTLLWPRGYIFHVGDSRGYYLRRGRLKQFTSDQTVGDFMVDAGILSEEQARKGGLHDVLTHAIGGDEATPAVGVLDFEPGDVLMMCSDGLTKHVADDDIRAVLEDASSAEEACRDLLEAALEGGGSDNITVIVARMGDV